MAAPAPRSGVEDARTPLHEERLDTVADLLRNSGAETVLDLGCGSGGLLRRLAGEEQFSRMVGIDTSLDALRQAERALAAVCDPDADRLSLVHGSFTAPDARLAGFEAAAMVETVEHVPPGRLSVLERVVFTEWRPAFVVMTTPNREYNVLYGMGEGEYRHPDHHFEWCRAKFRSWVTGVAQRSGYEVECDGIGPTDPLLGSPTQIGLFRRKAA
jgi:3' terminal RNA ribose 2'-O-methyltransferase Hen1